MVSYLGTHSPIRGVALARTRNGGTGHLRATRLFVRRARPGLYFNRVPSLPATDDGSARPLAEDLSTDSDGSENITWDDDTEPVTADAGAVPEAGRADSGPRAPEDQSRMTEASAEQEADAKQGITGPAAAPQADQSGTGIAPRADDESRADGPAADAEPQAGEARSGGAPTADAEPRVGESGRWFRPAKAEAGFLAIPADKEADSALPGGEPQVTAADASADGAVTTPGPATPGTAEASTAEASTAEASTAEASTAEASKAEASTDGTGGPTHWPRPIPKARLLVRAVRT